MAVVMAVEVEQSRSAGAQAPQGRHHREHDRAVTAQHESKVAARQHYAVGRVQDFIEVPDGVQPLNFGDDEGPLAGRFGGGTHSFNVTASLHERLAHGVHSVLQRKFQTNSILRGKGTDTESDTGQIQTLFGAQFATDQHLAANFAARNLLDRQLHQAVVQEEPVAGLYDSREALKTHRYPS